MRIALAGKSPMLKSSLIFGGSRAGKTWLNCTWPRVAWLGSQREGGYETIRFMDPSAFYEPAYPPIVFAVSSIAEVVEHLRKDLPPLIRAGKVQTVVVELSFYSDDVIQGLTRSDEKNGWVKYQTLEQHMSHLDTELKKAPILVAYNALAAQADDAKIGAGILVAGRATGRKHPAAMDLFAYLRAEDRGQGKVDRVLHLSPYGPYQCGHRFGDRLPPAVRNPTFRKLQDLLARRAVVDAEGNVVPQEIGELPPVSSFTQ